MQGLRVVGSMIINAALEVFSLMSLLPLLYLFTEESVLAESQIVAAITLQLGINKTSFLYLAIAVVLVLFVFKSFIGYKIEDSKINYAYRISLRLSDEMFQSILRGEYLELIRKNSTFNYHKIAHIPGTFAHNIVLSYLTILSESIILILIFVAIVIYDWQMFLLLTGVMIPGAYILSRLKQRQLVITSNDLKNYYPKLSQYALEGIQGFLDINTTQSHNFFVDKFNAVNKKLTNNYVKHTLLMNTSYKFVELVAVGGICLLFAFAIFTNQSPQETMILIMAFSAAAYRTIPSVNKIFGSYSQIKSHRFVVEELQSFKMASEHKPAEHVTPVEFVDKITFENVSFSYDQSADILSNINWTINKGDRIAIMGESGQGKSTLLLLILHLLKPSEGFIKVDGEVIPKEDIAGWLSLIGYVRQDPFIIDGSLEDNIAFGIDKEEVDRDRVSDLIGQLGLDFLMNDRFEKGESIGESGNRISGGQKQRIAIGRALYFRKQILILDEVTSNLDSETERQIISLIDSVARRNNLTLIIVSHKKETLESWDKILRLENGMLSEIKSTLPVLDQN